MRVRPVCRGGFETRPYGPDDLAAFVQPAPPRSSDNRAGAVSRACPELVEGAAQFFVSLPAWKANTAPSLMPSGQRVVMVLRRVLKRMPSMPCM